MSVGCAAGTSKVTLDGLLQQDRTTVRLHAHSSIAHLQGLNHIWYHLMLQPTVLALSVFPAGSELLVSTERIAAPGQGRTRIWELI